MGSYLSCPAVAALAHSPFADIIDSCDSLDSPSSFSSITMAFSGCSFVSTGGLFRRHLPLVSLKSHTSVVSSTSRTTLTQTFINPQETEPIAELRYSFPLYDGVSVVAFVCTINNDRVIRGRVKEKEAARRDYKDAVDRGETAGLLEQLPDASDVFTTTIGNVPAGAEIRVEITYLGELKHDAEADGMRFTIPTTIAPRYGSMSHDTQPLPFSAGWSRAGGIDITVDVEIPAVGSNHIKTIKSPSHPISVEMKAFGATGMSAATAELSIGALELDKDFVVIVVLAKPDAPVVVLEQHPSIAHQRALMATFVPRFNLPQIRPEIVFVCDRSGSMGMGKRIPNLIAALHVFLRSLPVGPKFNIVSFGSSHSFLFERSRSYSQSSLDEASRHVDTFDSGYGGTELLAPIDDVFKRRYADMELEIFVLTDGEVWNQSKLFDMVNSNIAKCQGAARLFTLGIGNDVSTALVEGLARAGRGFAQIVGDEEKLNSKVVRMLKASLSTHINDYSLEIQYAAKPKADTQPKPLDDFEMVEESDGEGVLIEKVLDALTLDVEKEQADAPTPDAAADKKPISLFDSSADPDADPDADGAPQGVGEAKYAHVPAVPIPKLLQAPFEIPPMYNFSRTSIYVLLGPSSCQRTPKAFVLRGTTASHEPVELSMPVQVLAQPGETVHQLAAKKAVQDLEEGRGWLAQAKDAADSRLLKEKHEGRFPDMVEREAVRLGVGFQVGGKWCSFVAVDDSTSEAEAPVPGQAMIAEQLVSVKHAKKASPPRRRVARQSVAQTGFSTALHSRVAESNQLIDRIGNKSDRADTGLRTNRRKLDTIPRDESNRGGLFGSASSSGFGQTSSFGQPSTASAPFGSGSPRGANLFGSSSPAPAPTAPPALALFGGQVPASPSFGQTCSFGQGKSSLFGQASPAPTPGGGSLFGAPSPAPLDPAACYEDFSIAAACPPPPAPAGSFGAPAPPPPPGAPLGFEGGSQPSGDVSTDPLPTIVKQQEFEGSWSWTPTLRTAMGLTEEAVLNGLPSDVAAGKVGATVCVVAFLRKKLAGSADEWEMLAEKAVAWLEDQGIAVEPLLAKAELLF
ncbi:hypothetical protein GGTG_05059 [Gaeumannomyces tritici R3-111a-1]|uniref:von Willebrand domain-containing protein n=1 Tax=Gaeumannomyces tritici (strain R3-111a-1) TaxID=644352 RepID=J3NUV3_GAET3|nr:hypothetical protein GGTG_05059 [Gaeumannomyces tritici R3-111a-1]EJT79977.1 hypothetical protein GGTG_05059 [Gaeumannomyces tritici R3-111a-1]